MMILIGLLFLFIFLGIPVAFSVGASSIIYILLDPTLSETTAVQRLVAGVNSFTFLAIPFFIFAGNLMNNGGITRRIFEFAAVCVAHVRGGLAHVNVASSVIFAGMSGAAVADAGGLGASTIKAMRDKGYGERVSIGVTAASSIIGPIIPPSMAIIVYAIASSESIERLFAAGIIPGLLMALSLMIVIYFFSDRLKCPSEKRASRKALLLAFGRAVPSLMAPVIILGGIFTGIFSPTESAAIACSYAIILSVIYKDFSFTSFKTSLKESVITSVQVLVIVASANLFAWIMTSKEVPQTLAQTILSSTDNFLLILLALNILLLVVGLFIETVAAINLLVPILLPVMVNGFGMDPVQLGIIVVLNLIIGTLTPPFGTVLFVLSSVSNTPVEKVTKYTATFLPPLLLVLLFVNLIPGLTLWLPEFFFGK
ncbi:TRAP transporter large permease [Photobacterium sp. GJ3]|uniref:TRAP transporter large permease n=1 Tax=Photobacterium sp. GJ3 TaxID=2829502 RepID=UPI001B8BB315|nr:TRAP transporter large permease [Photobacterium sp. GJ3]QUJ67976.1 TRAP transporter large permease [Photobacterium sp. GJ3]